MATPFVRCHRRTVLGNLPEKCSAVCICTCFYRVSVNVTAAALLRNDQQVSHTLQIWALAVLGEQGGLRQDVLDAFVDAIEEVPSLETAANGNSAPCLCVHGPACACLLPDNFSASSSSLGLTAVDVQVFQRILGFQSLCTYDGSNPYNRAGPF